MKESWAVDAVSGLQHDNAATAAVDGAAPWGESSSGGIKLRISGVLMGEHPFITNATI